MTKQPVDRTGSLNGMNRAVRDFRVPASSPRLLENLSLPDAKPKRRTGFKRLNTNAVRTQALCKATSTTTTKRLIESETSKGVLINTPLSYGLIRWNTDFQLRRGVPKTIEFNLRLGEKEELVKNTFSRRANYPGQWTNYVFRDKGVCVLDQTLLSNNHIFDTGTFDNTGFVPGTTYDMGAFLTATQFDVLPLTSIACFYNETSITFVVGMVESSGPNVGRYWHTKLQYILPSYVEGSIYHVALVHDPSLGSFGRLLLYVNGLLCDSVNILDILVFTGEWDKINGIVYLNGQKRDIVLLNECTARGSYASACKIRLEMHGHQTFFQDFSNAPNVGANPWALSPPRGTAMWDLRIWNESRSASNIVAFSKKRILPTDSGISNLKGNWWLNDGGPVCTNKISATDTSYCTIHHGYPGYVNNTTLLSGIGLKLGEGQHLIKRTTNLDKFVGNGFAAQLDNVFDDTVSAVATLKHKEQNSFSVMMQFTVPDAFQPELNDNNADPLSMKDIALVETRRYMNTGCIPYDALLDGAQEDSVTSRQRIGHPTDPTVGPDITQHLRAYDQTLWSIEGTQETSSENVTDEPSRRRIPIARGVITPAGKIAFELMKAQTAGAQAKYCRLLSSSTLVVGHVYTATFVQRCNYVYNGANNTTDASGWQMEIWLQDVTVGASATLDSSFVFAAGSTVTTQPCKHDNNYDISIGASYVNDGWDHSINMPAPGSGGVAPAIPKTMYCPAPSLSTRGNTGPWPVQQRFMSPYQDQPGNFVLGMFRLWTVPLSSTDIVRFSSAKIVSTDQSADLIVNLEFSEVTGTEIPNKSRYPDVFVMGYKAWGMPQGYREKTYQIISLTAYLKKELFEGTWAYEDCLGYMPIDSVSYDARQSYARVSGLGAVKASYGQQYGLLATFEDSVSYDEKIDGTYVPQFVNNHGLMSEFLSGFDWKTTIVGDRTILTSPYSLPKVFDGKKLNVAGFKKWSGGVPIVYHTASAVATLSNGWYGVVVVYWVETAGIYQVSPVTTIKVDTGVPATANAIGLFMVPQHPNSRVTLIEVYRTLPQATQDLAKSAPLYKTKIVATGSAALPRGSAGGNNFAESVTLEQPDSQLSSAVLDRFVTEMPVVAYSAAMNERLYLAGDPLNPDTVYWTDPGNPERLDSFANNLTLPQGSGDTITGLVAAFGAIYVFKPSAIWRIDDIGGNRHQVTQVTSVGAVSDKSIALIANPDDGQISIFFWSKYGPYLFNGSTPQYVGLPIEEFPATLEDKYYWLNPASVVVGHNQSNREIICYYTPRFLQNDGSILEMDRNGHAVVFNYRLGAWSKFTGMLCSNVAHISIASNSGVSLDTRALATIDSFLVVGAHNGRVYKWGASKYDGAETPTISYENYGKVSYVSSNVLNIQTFPVTEDLVGCWLTVVNTVTNDWHILPIIGYDPVTKYVTTSFAWQNADGNSFVFNAAENYTAYLCRPFAKIEYPFDEMDVPYYDKDIVEFVLYADKAYQYRTRVNYAGLTEVAWTVKTDPNNQRDRTQIKKTCESFKLELASKEIDFSVSGIVYQQMPKMGANTKQ